MILIDTSVWMLALRRSPRQLSAHEKVIVANLVELVREGLAVLIGPVRQELLSGIREEAVFEDLRQHLAAFLTSRLPPKNMNWPSSATIGAELPVSRHHRLTH